MTAFITVVSGVVVFVAGQIILKLVIEPMQDQASTIGSITHALIFYANLVDEMAPEEPLWEAKWTYRDQAAALRRTLRTARPYRVLSSVRLVLPRDRIEEASSSLIGLSNAIGNPSRYEMIDERRRKICEALEIEGVA